MHFQLIKILIIEDDLNIVKSISRMFSRQKEANFELLHADCLKAGMDLLSQTHFDAILLDLTLPDSQGLSTFETIKPKCTYIPVIVMTGMTDKQIAPNVIKNGAQDFIYKPELDQDILIKSIFYAIERKKIEASLINNEQYYRGLAENAKDMIFTCDFDGVINYVNRAALEITGYSIYEMTGLGLANIIADDQVESLIDIFEKQSKNEETNTLWRGNFVTKGGELIAAEASVTLFKGPNNSSGLLVLARDIRNRERAYEAIKNNEKKLLEIIEKSAEGIAIIDPDGIILFTNPAFRELLGRDFMDHIGRHIDFELTPGKKSEIEVKHKNNLTNTVEVQTVPTKWEGLGVYLCTFHDITIRKRVETELKRLTDDLQKNVDELTKANQQILEQQKFVIQEERLKVLLQLSENTFHDINQPLNMIKNSIESIKTDIPEHSIAASHINKMEEACLQIGDTLKRVDIIKNENFNPDVSKLRDSMKDKKIDILAVEDSQFSYIFLNKLLAKETNITLNQAKTLLEAREALKEKNYDMIFLDYNLPDGKGIDFLNELKDKKVDIPVIVITGKGDEMVASRMIQAGAYEYIPKDAINKKDLLSAIAKAMAKHNLQKEIKLVQEKIVEMSTRDELTGLFNYRYFIETLNRECASSNRYNYDLVLCMLDIDHFKNINDSYGHPTGDEVLVTFGKLLKENSRISDLPCRYGGEEFTVLLPHTSIENAYPVMERFRCRLENTLFTFNGKKFPVTVSIGLTVTNGNNKKSTTLLIDEADKALYNAKRAGRNRTVIFDDNYSVSPVP
jgi:two-component system, cell cycle response regulator